MANVEAIHPGYGFLSENADFAEVCRDVQDRVHRPAARGDATSSGNKNEATQARPGGRRCPLVPGSEGLITTEDEALKFARQIGYPVLIKAAAGGGGRGMRVARNDVSLQSGLQPARQEAEAAFKDGSVYLEKYLEQPAARRGAAPRRPARQRRPPVRARLLAAAAAPEAGRGVAGPEPARRGRGEEMCAAAVRLAKAAGLLQRRHLRVPGRPGEQLLLHRGERPHPGRAPGHGAGDRHRPGPRADPHRGRREAAVHAEGHRPPRLRRSSAGSTPRTRPTTSARRPGRSRRWQPPGGPGVRLDTHVVAGYRVPPNYDSHGGQAARPPADAGRRRSR